MNGRVKHRMELLSDHNRNVRILAPVEMSGVTTLSLLPLERLSPRMICGWTPLPSPAILRPAVGRIGLRRSATRAPGGRLYASGPGSLRGSRVVGRLRTGVGRQCDKLISGLTVLEVM